MPVAGLPAAAETTLNALLSENAVSSWKIAGEGDSTVFVLRLKPQVSQTTNNMAAPMPVYYRKKPPGQVRRDNKRAKQRQQQREEEEETTNKASERQETANESEILFSSPNFHPSQEHCTYNRPMNININAREPCLDTVGGECGSGACNLPDLNQLSTEAAVGHDFSMSDPMYDSRPTVDPRVLAASNAGFSPDVVGDYVASLVNKETQRSLRNNTRNVNICKTVLDTSRPAHNHPALLFESDDIVLEYTIDKGRTHRSYWFVKQQRQQMLQEEFQKLQVLRRCNNAPDTRFQSDRAVAERDLINLRDLMAYFLG
jgi:hypothetical protein